MNSLKNWIFSHKKTSITVAVLALLFGWFVFFRSSPAQTQYALAQVQKGTLVVSVSGTGQVSNSSSVDIKPQATGTIVYSNQNLVGKSVAAGTLIAEIDPTTAEKSVRDAQLSLQASELSLQKLQASQTTDQPKAQDTITTDQNNLNKDYQSGFNDVSTAFINLPDDFNTAHDVLYGDALNGACKPDFCQYPNLVDLNYRTDLESLIDTAKSDFATASVSYNQSLDVYKNETNASDPNTISSLISGTLNAAQELSQALKDEQTMLSTVVGDIQTSQPNETIPSAVTSYQSSVGSALTSVNTQVSTLLSIKNTLVSDNQNLAADQRSLSSLQQTDPIDLQTQENSLAKAQAALSDAQATLANYYIRAPFAGVISANTYQRGADSSAGSASIISPQQVVDISLNEVDIAKISVGQQATLTFDAIPNLTLTGKVVSVDPVGTVSQGVVSYDVKIAFDSSNNQVKSGMSVTANIITAVKQNVLEVPSGAVKTQGGQSYVQTLAVPDSLKGQALVSAAALKSQPQNVPVVIGDQNDTMTEIASGLNEGDTVVIRTVTGAVTTGGPAATGGSARSGKTFFGGGGGGGRQVQVISK